jgi:hypothetical protein
MEAIYLDCLREDADLRPMRDNNLVSAAEMVMRTDDTIATMRSALVTSEMNDANLVIKSMNIYLIRI